MLKINLFHDEIFVFTPTGDVISLVEDATPIDFAFQVHSQVGLKCSGSKVNGKIVPLNTNLKNGDTVEVITSNNKNPSYAWLKIVKMPKSKHHIKRWIKKNEHKEKIILGQEILEKGLRKIKNMDLLKDIENNFNLFDFSNFEELYLKIANGKITIQDIIEKIKPKSSLDFSVKDETLTEKFIRRARGIAHGVSVGGLDNALIHYGKCCNPIPGDNIIGYITQGRGVTIHRVSCNNYPILSTNERLIEVNWQISNTVSFMVRLQIEGEDRKGLAKDIVECTSSLNINISSVDMKGNEGVAKCSIIVEVRDTKQLTRLQTKLKTVNRIYKIERR
jgi:GTP pyrophosphokinase